MIDDRQTKPHKTKKKEVVNMVYVGSRVFWWLGIKVFWHLSRWELVWKADPKVNKYCFWIVVWCSLTGKCKTVSAQKIIAYDH